MGSWPNLVQMLWQLKKNLWKSQSDLKPTKLYKKEKRNGDFKEDMNGLPVHAEGTALWCKWCSCYYSCCLGQPTILPHLQSLLTITPEDAHLCQVWLDKEQRKRQCCVSSYILIRHSFITSPKLWRSISVMTLHLHRSSTTALASKWQCSSSVLHAKPRKVGLTLLPLEIGVPSRVLHTVGAWYTFHLLCRYWATEIPLTLLSQTSTHTQT